ncbi:unnamed protein product [Caenorhabditis angaria]|uniref:nicotinate phosphoribosyltransferase n=1 Tax=Caenorhabditis angaria TaxID=860376 RepID=A0A9P1IM50_9PELO|nr:unnamed protein product [Caenorhabditis angaria]
MFSQSKCLLPHPLTRLSVDHFEPEFQRVIPETGTSPDNPQIAIRESKRALVMASRVEQLHNVYWENGVLTQELPKLDQIKQHVKESIKSLRQDHRRYLNPTPYKVQFLGGF